MAATKTIENEAPIVLDAEGSRVRVPKPQTGVQKYIRLKNRDGFVISWHPEIHIKSDEMEVFESDVLPPEYIPNLVDWMVSVQNQKAAEAAKKAKAA